MGWGSGRPSDGGCSPRGARRGDTAPFPGRSRSHPYHSSLKRRHQGLDRDSWLGHPRGARVPLAPHKGRGLYQYCLGGSEPPGQSGVRLVPGRQREDGRCPGGAGLKDIYHPPGQCLAAIGSSGTRGPPPTGFMVGGNSQTQSVPVSPSQPGTNPRAEGREPG